MPILTLLNYLIYNSNKPFTKYCSDDLVAVVKAVNAGFARLSHEVFQNIQKLNAHGKDQAQLLQEMIRETISGFNERLYLLSAAHFDQQEAFQIIFEENTAAEVARALATDKNLPLAEKLSSELQRMSSELKTFEVHYLTTLNRNLNRL